MRAAIYSRFSSALQSEGSIEDQERLCMARAAREGWHVVARFEDRAISGSSMVRPGLQALLEAAQSGKFDILLTEALDRLSRDQADVAALYKQLSFAGLRIVTLAEGEISELHVGLKGTMNQLFLKDLAAKTRRGLRGRGRQPPAACFVHGGRGQFVHTNGEYLKEMYDVFINTCDKKSNYDKKNE